MQRLHPNLVVSATNGEKSTARVSGLEEEVNFSALCPATVSSSQPRASLTQEGQREEG